MKYRRGSRRQLWPVVKGPHSSWWALGCHPSPPSGPHPWLPLAPPTLPEGPGSRPLGPPPLPQSAGSSVQPYWEPEKRGQRSRQSWPQSKEVRFPGPSPIVATNCESHLHVFTWPVPSAWVASIQTQVSLLTKGIPGTHLALLHTSPLDLSVRICKTGTVTSAFLASQGSRENLIFWSQDRQTWAEHWRPSSTGRNRAPGQLRPPSSRQRSDSQPHPLTTEHSNAAAVATWKLIQAPPPPLTASRKTSLGLKPLPPISLPPGDPPGPQGKSPIPFFPALAEPATQDRVH